MKDYGLVYGSTQPQAVEITPDNVFVATNIESYKDTFDGKSITGYKYHYVSYTKDEYLLELVSNNAQLQQQVLDTQMALVDLYESLEQESEDNG